MINKKILVQGFVATMLFTGCMVSSPSLYPGSKKKVVAVENVSQLPILKAKKDEKTHFHIVYNAKHTKPTMDSYVNARGSLIDLAKLPTVVIALPVEMNKGNNVENELDASGEFKTEGYINQSEVTVEKELIRFGFNVIDRSKFEAKLRTSREKNQKLTTGDNLYEAKVNLLKKQLNAKKITNKEYINKLTALNDISSSRRRGNKELVDMSELIRAAQSSGVQADYILQLNKIEEYKGYVTSLPLKGDRDLEDYILQNPDISYGNGANKIPFSFDTKVFRVVFSAKLFNVKTGKVIWSGSHELNSLDIEDITVDFDIVKRDASTKIINKDRVKFNNRAEEVYTETQQIQKTLQALYKKASKVREYEDKEIQSYSENQLKNDIKKYEKALRENNELLKKFHRYAKNNSEEIKFEYLVSDLYIKPNLNTLDKDIKLSDKKIIEKHRERLLAETIRSLFHTIKVKNK